MMMRFGPVYMLLLILTICLFAGQDEEEFSLDDLDEQEETIAPLPMKMEQLVMSKAALIPGIFVLGLLLRTGRKFES